MHANLKLFLVLVFIVLAGFLLRWLYIESSSLVFSYDQARDAYLATDILKGDIKIQGPPTSTRDFFHGVLYYYVLAVGYFLAAGSPAGAVVFNSLLNLGGALVFFILASKFTGSRRAAAVSALLLAVSYEQTQFSTYLANTFLATITVPLLYLGLYLWVSRRFAWGPLLAGVGLGLSVQANFFLLYHVPVVVLLFLSRQAALSKSSLLKFAAGFLLCVSTMILSEAKFGFPSRNGFLNLINRPSYTELGVSSARIITTYTGLMSDTFRYNLLPRSPQLSLVIVAAAFAVLLVRRPRGWILPVLLLFSSAPAIWLGGISTPYLNVGISTAVFIALAFLLKSYPLPGLVIAALVMAGNLTYTLEDYRDGQSQFSIQKTMLLKYELAAVDYIYSQAEGRPFSLNTITAPLFSNTTWSYLFNWHGRLKYGYLPYWHGRDQIGQPGNNLSRPTAGVRPYFVIIEPTQGLPEDIVNNLLDEEKGYSSFNHKLDIYGITIHNRTSVRP